MHEWSDLSRGRALALVSARDPREFPIGIMQRDPVPPPHTGPGTFIWFADDAEAAEAKLRWLNHSFFAIGISK